jgi:hypothetical protein
MRGWLKRLSLVVAGILAVSGVMLAQKDQQPEEASATPDLSGLWLRPREVGPRAAMLFSTEEPLMLPWAAERYKAIRKGRKGVSDVRPDQGRGETDPGQHPYCMPFGFPRVYAYTDAFEIVPGPGRVYILFESSQVQRIYTDGRTFPKGPPLTFMGQSIGRWEGDTLVVETKDINDLTWIDSIGHLHSDELRVEQRIRRVDHDTLEMTFLFDDPKTYTKPWGGKKTFKLRPKEDYVMNYFHCEDPTRVDFLRNVLGKKEGQ